MPKNHKISKCLNEACKGHNNLMLNEIGLDQNLAISAQGFEGNLIEIQKYFTDLSSYLLRNHRHVLKENNNIIV